MLLGVVKHGGFQRLGSRCLVSFLYAGVFVGPFLANTIGAIMAKGDFDLRDSHCSI